MSPTKTPKNIDTPAIQIEAGDTIVLATPIPPSEAMKGLPGGEPLKVDRVEGPTARGNVLITVKAKVGDRMHYRTRIFAADTPVEKVPA